MVFHNTYVCSVGKRPNYKNNLVLFFLLWIKKIFFLELLALNAQFFIVKSENDEGEFSP